MTDITNQPNPRDVRMAAVLTIHHRNGDNVGVAEIVRDAAEGGRASGLLEALLHLHMIAMVQLHTETGVAYIRSQVGDIAAIVPTDVETVDMHRAARILDGHGRGDLDAINEVLRSLRADNRGTQTLLALLNIYAVILPELSSTAGRQWLDTCVAASHTEEANE
ncbi:hypothetical protein [Mycobacterium attenuatum]|uniref:hypothetical protein n=1 Tax=Mycobacterium attenuatum TaxID=2341086 RepID=UPI000F02CCB6|nr:hypothetical protein [Mycobacterium attenuatum]VBA62109.1 hypothetical protein LAUMK41_05496 [Mycobacterium attenuatum]